MASRASSASEGEVVEHQHKANSISQHGERRINGSDRVFGRDGASDKYGASPPQVPRPSRHMLITSGYKYRALSRSPSPYRRKRTRSPSPYRHQRGPSRSPSPFRHGRDNREPDDSRSIAKRKALPLPGGRPEKRHHTDRSRHRERRPKPHLEDIRAAPSQPTSYNGRPHAKPISYADNERPAPVPDFRDGLYPADRPAHHGRDDYQRRGIQRESQPNGQVASHRQSTAAAPSTQSKDVEMRVPLSFTVDTLLIDDSRTSPKDELEHPLEPANEDKAPAQETREEKRRRWAAIRAAAEKDKPKDNLLQQALLANASESTTPNIASPAAPVESSVSPAGSPRIGDLDSVPASPDVMVVDKQGGVSEANSPTADGTSAADYDPTKDMLDDRDRAAQKARQSELPSDAYSETNPKLLSTLPAEKAGPAKKQKKEFDMFDFEDDEDENEEAGVEEAVNDIAKGTVLDEKLLDNWDDPEGYYKVISNELVNGGRYRMIKSLGRGVFANVAQAEDVKIQGDDTNHKLVAIKMIRRNDLMRKASQKEMDFLRKVNDADPHDKRHIIRLLGSFDHKGHLCVVFEHMSKNLRDLLKEDTNGHGLSLQAVRTYARQMFIGLQHLQNCQVVHCDLKPDNILVSPDKKTIKLCDFGTAVDKRDLMERTEYLVSRFYRAPEIILGMDIGYGIDMWAIGCTIYELWTGKILFTGRTNNQMVKAFMDCLGWPTEKLLKKGLLQNVLEHFEAGPPLKFISREVDQHGIVRISPMLFCR